MTLRWPRGKYNGRRITGFKVSGEINVAFWRWIPIMKANWGMPYCHWLCMIIRFETVYHYLDK